MIYEKTEDPNIVRQIKTVVSRIYLDKLEGQILKIRAQLNSIPEAKTEPDQETLDFWNEMVALPLNREELEGKLRKKERLLELLREL